jgi:hypothetical protein
MPIGHRGLPYEVTCRGIQGHHGIVKSADKNLAISVGHALIEPAAAEKELCRILSAEARKFPYLFAGGGIQGEYVVVTVSDEQAAADRDG